MSFLGKFFNRKPLEGLLEINERVLAFDYCFNTDVMEGDEFKVYIEGIVEQLHDDFPEASFMVFDFRGGKSHSLIDEILSDYDMTVVDYPRQYQDCPLLALETIYHFLKSCESWLSVGEHNMLLMNCERGGWPILAFVLSALVLYMKQYNGERKTLDMIYKLGPSELLPLMSPLNPIPSQVRYLQYVSRRNVGTQWPPLDRQLLLDCVILRVIPQFDGAGGCRPIFKVYGQDPFVAINRTPKVLFSTPKKGKPVRHYNQEDCPLVKIDIRCHVQGDVVVECINLDDDMEHEEMIFRAMFNTAFLRSNILMLNRNDIDMLWHCQDRFAKEFRAEILFSEMDAATTPVSNEVRGFEEKGLPMEAFAKVQEIFSNVDLLDTKTEIALDVLQQIDQSTVLQEKLETGSSISVEAGNLLLKIVPENFQEKQASPAESRTPEKMSEWKQSTHALKLSIDVKDSEPQEQVSLSQSKIISQRMPQTTVLPDSNSYQSEPSSLGITTVLHDLGASNSEEVAHLVTTDSSPSSSSSVPISNTSVNPGTIGIIEGSTPTPTVSMSMKSHSLGPLVEDPTGLAKNPVTQLSSKASSPTVLDVDNSLSTPLPRPTLPKTSGPSAPPSSGSMPSSTDIHSKGTTPLPPTVQAPSANTAPSSAAPPRHRTRSTGRSPTRPSFSTRRPPPSGLLDASSTPSPPSNSGQSASSKRSSQMLMKSFSTSGQAPPTQPPVARSASGRVADSPTPPPPPPALTRASSSRIDPQPPPPPPPSSSHASPSSTGPPPPPPSGSSKVAAPPPPPSRTGSVSGPPPPGPPGPPGTMLTRGRTITRVSSSRDPGRPNLKPYHWLKLPRAMQGSLWDETQKSDESSMPPEIDLSELESFFSVASAKRKGKGGKSAEAAAPKSEKVQLVDLRRAYICEIMLSKVKTPLPELVNSVLAMDDSALDIDQIENLIKFCPTKEERETLKNYTGDKDKLGKCEHLFYELMKVPRMEAKLRVFSFKLQFTSQASDLRDSLNIVNSAADEIKNSTKLKRVMQTILSLGNALNHGTARGSAIGFRLDSLLKLTDTRARKSKMTLMHYLCKVIAKEMPEILDFPQDLGSLEAATKIQLKYLAEEMQAISKGLEKVEQELTGSENDGAVSEGFCKLLRGFLGYAEADVRSLTKIYSVVGRNADALARYFGEDPARCPFEQVVATLNVFAKTFARAHTENVKQMELDKKKEQKDAENKTMEEKNEAE